MNAILAVCATLFTLCQPGAASVLVRPIWQRNEGQILLFAYLLWMSTSLGSCVDGKSVSAFILIHRLGSRSYGFIEK